VPCEVDEAALVRLDHLLQVGRFMPTFAHEVNNCLHVISGLAELAQEADGLPPSVAHKLGRIIEQAGRASGSIRRVIAFARERGTAPVGLNLGAIVADAVALRHYPLSRLNADVRIDREPGQPLDVLGSPRELEQLVLALVLNAEQALFQIEPPRRLTLALGADDHMVSLRVSDNGAGVPLSMQDTIFEPFTSGPAQEEASGLGLAAARLIAEGHGGHISIEDRAEGGATFLVRLPRH
jgi:signal transduction histidine kinase